MRPELSLRQAAKVLLTNQSLGAAGRKGGVVSVVKRVCGLNAQSARGPYLSLWNRVDGFKRMDLTEALFEKRLLIKAWLMRGTVHIVSVDEFPVYQRAVGRSLTEGWREQMKRRGLSLAPRTELRFHSRVLKVLAGKSLTKTELLSRVKHFLKGVDEREQKRRIGYALRELTYMGLVCHARPTGPWYHFKENRFSLVEDWFGGARPTELTEAEARRMLFQKYLRGYGPASIHDFAYWAGFSVRESRSAFEALDDELAAVAVKGCRYPTWMMRDDVGSLDLADSVERVPIRLLPEFDPLIMGHKDKTRILDEKDRKDVFLRLADVAPTLLINGRVLGVWNYRMSDGIFSLRIFGEKRDSNEPDLQGAVARVKDFFGSE